MPMFFTHHRQTRTWLLKSFTLLHLHDCHWHTSKTEQNFMNDFISLGVWFFFLNTQKVIGSMEQDFPFRNNVGRQILLIHHTRNFNLLQEWFFEKSLLVIRTIPNDTTLNHVISVWGGGDSEKTLKSKNAGGRGHMIITEKLIPKYINERQ